MTTRTIAAGKATARAAFAAAAALLAAPAPAAPAVGLIGDRTLALFDTDSPAVTRSVEAQGVDRLLGIDMRPADGALYGVSASGALLRIDPRSGAAETVAALGMTHPGALPTVVDFNPAADKLRFMEGVRNLRADPATGAVTEDKPLAFRDGDMLAGQAPNIVAAAYYNSFGKPEKTGMVNVDASAGALVRQAPPNDGVLSAIGKLGVAPAMVYAFDIHTTADGANTGWLVADNVLHRVDLETGAATRVAPVAGARGAIRDVAVMQAR
jgi:hypothetical protein